MIPTHTGGASATVATVAIAATAITLSRAIAMVIVVSLVERPLGGAQQTRPAGKVAPAGAR